MSNRYWGWGREDDELYVRLKKAGLKVSLFGKCSEISNTFLSRCYEMKCALSGLESTKCLSE